MIIYASILVMTGFVYDQSCLPMASGKATPVLPYLCLKVLISLSMGKESLR